MRREPTSSQLASAVIATLKNAAALVVEARLLLSNSSPHRAVVLAIQTMEEVGRITLLIAFSRHKREGRLKEWSAKLERHDPKAQLFALATLLSEAGRDPILDMANSSLYAKALQSLKMHCLYTDWDGTTFHSPQDLVAIEEKAEAMVLQAEKSVRSEQDRLGDLTPSLLEALWRRQEQFERVRSDPEALENWLADVEQRKGASIHTIAAIRDISAFVNALDDFSVSQQETAQSDASNAR